MAPAPAPEAALLGDVRRTPERAASWSRLGCWYLDQGDLAMARLCGERAMALDASDVDAFLLAAATSGLDTGDPTVHRELYVRAVEADAAHPYVHASLALAHLAAGQKGRASLRLRDALLARPHDIHIRRALRPVLARSSALYRWVAAPRRAVDWVRRRLAASRFAGLPVLEIAYAAAALLGLLHNPFQPLKPTAIFSVAWLMVVWWPLMAGLEALASARLRSGPGWYSPVTSARHALAALDVHAVLASAALVASGLLWKVAHEPALALFLTVFVEVNSTLLSGGLLAGEVVRRWRTARRRRKLRELLSASR